MVTRERAYKIAEQARRGLEAIYGDRLRGVYLFGSAARGDVREDSDIDIAIILDAIVDRFEEHERTSELGSQLTLAENLLVSFLFAPKADLDAGLYSVHRAIKAEGQAV